MQHDFEVLSSSDKRKGGKLHCAAVSLHEREKLRIRVSRILPGHTRASLVKGYQKENERPSRRHSEDAVPSLSTGQHFPLRISVRLSRLHRQQDDCWKEWAALKTPTDKPLKKQRSESQPARSQVGVLLAKVFTEAVAYIFGGHSKVGKAIYAGCLAQGHLTSLKLIVYSELLWRVL